ncbi:DUF4334 domain-containing protein [Burkholderia ubonensis]|uniref:DUF4334 domain-containing protein n=1 Tax=Burkholderia ubonensis TaxID=101571 RepID=UPI001E4DB38A|nr:DUF4334 domain-containing protein [Burkholderia ubonensis]
MNANQEYPSESPSAWLVQRKEKGTTMSEALTFFDTLPPAELDELIGTWRGSGLRTGHPIDGVLEGYGWYGKDFSGSNNVQPLLFRNGPENVVALNPTLMPIKLLVRHPEWFRRKAARLMFTALFPLLRTARPRARMRMMEHRGVISATMIYDDLPILDTFRRVDHNTMLGLMDLRDMTKPFFFTLHRDG